MSQNFFQGQEPPNQPVPPYGTPPAPGSQPPPYSQPGQENYYQQQQPYPPQAAGNAPQTPYGQTPYGQAPYGAPQQPAQSLTSRPGYLVAGGGAVIAFIAYFLAYYTVSFTFGGQTESTSGSGSQVGGGFVLDILLSIAAVLVVALILFGRNLFGSAGGNTLVTSLTTKARTWAIAVVAIGGVGAVLHLLFMLTNSPSSGSTFGSTGVSVGWGFGAILYLLAMAAVAVGGVMEMLKLNPR